MGLKILQNGLSEGVGIDWGAHCFLFLSKWLKLTENFFFGEKIDGGTVIWEQRVHSFCYHFTFQHSSICTYLQIWKMQLFVRSENICRSIVSNSTQARNQNLRINGTYGVFQNMLSGFLQGLVLWLLLLHRFINDLYLWIPESG